MKWTSLNHQRLWKAVVGKSYLSNSTSNITGFFIKIEVTSNVMLKSIEIYDYGAFIGSDVPARPLPAIVFQLFPPKVASRTGGIVPESIAVS